MTFSFSGSSIALVSSLGPDRGKATIAIDGVKVATLDLYARKLKVSAIVWNGSLAPGTHT